jgi:general secretion pathway protein M
MISQLNQRERIFVAVGGVALILVLLYMAVLMPYRNALTRLDNQIEGRGRQLQEVEMLRAEYLELRQETAQVERLLDNRRDFSTLSFLETLVENTAGRENLLSMRPQAPVTRNQFILESVEIKLERLDLRQVLEMLWSIEKSPSPMQVSALYLKQRFDNRAQLDATMTVTALRRAS